MTGKEFFEDLLRGLVVGPGLQKAPGQAGEAGAYYGTMSGYNPPPAAGGKAGPAVKAASGPASDVDRMKQILSEAAHSKALSPAELAQEYFAPGGSMRNVAVWVVIGLVGLIGVWGLVAPGGGVAVIERVRK